MSTNSQAVPGTAELQIRDSNIDGELVLRAIAAAPTCDPERLAAMRNHTSELHLLFPLLLKASAEGSEKTAEEAAERIRHLLERLAVATDVVLRETRGAQ